MGNDTEITIGRVAHYSVYGALFAAIVLNLSDAFGTLAFADTKIVGGTLLFTLFGQRFTQEGLLVGALLFSMTTITQFIVSGMCYSSGVSPITAMVGGYLNLLVNIFPHQQNKGGKQTTNSKFTDDFNRVGNKFQGLATLMYFYPISHMIDIYTDIAFYKQTTFAWIGFLFIFGFASIFSEHFVYLLSISRTLAKPYQEVKKNSKVSPQRHPSHNSSMPIPTGKKQQQSNRNEPISSTPVVQSQIPPGMDIESLISGLGNRHQ